MGDYIKTAVEVRGPQGWAQNEKAVFTNLRDWPGHDNAERTSRGFFWQSYTMFSFLAGFRVEEVGITPVAPDRGLPEDACDDSLYRLLDGWGRDKHWMDDSPDPVTVAEKVANRNSDDIFGLSWVGADELLAVDYSVPVTSKNPPFETMTLKEALGALFAQHLEQLKHLGDPGDVRILFCFVH